MTEIIVLSLIIVGIVWLGLDTREDLQETREVNKRLFNRTWEHERFLMEIHVDCPRNVQDKIENYINQIQPL